MKQRNLIMTLIVAALCTNVAEAKLNGDLNQSQASNISETQRIEEIRALLNRLSELGALEQDANKEIKVRKSVMDELRLQGLVKEVDSQVGSICD